MLVCLDHRRVGGSDAEIVPLPEVPSAETPKAYDCDNDVAILQITANSAEYLMIYGRDNVDI
jgi:hypothetical protein